MPGDEKQDACDHLSLQGKVIDEIIAYGPPEDRRHIKAKSVPVMVCSDCGETFYGPAAEQAHHRSICQALGLLSPDEIRAIRDRFGESQEAFAQRTGIGVATLSRWERGRLIQTRALDNYLRLLDRTRRHPAGGPEPDPRQSRWRRLEVTPELVARGNSFRLVSLAAPRRDDAPVLVSVE